MFPGICNSLRSTASTSFESSVIPNCSQMAPWRPPGGPGVPRPISKLFLGAFGLPFWFRKCTNTEPEFARKPSTGFERHVGSYGCFLGQFGGRLWGHVGVFFRSPARKPDFVKNVFPPTWEHDFHGSGGVGKTPKTCPEAVCGRRRAPRASGEAPGLDL